MALHPGNNLSANISTLEMMRVIYVNEGNCETAQGQLQLRNNIPKRLPDCYRQTHIVIFVII